MQAISSLAPGAGFRLDGSTNITNWYSDDIPQPTQAEIDAEVIRLEGVYDGNAYQRTRADAYEEVKEQLDQLYHDMAADKGDKTGTWFAAIKAVKDATPKP